MQNLLITGGSGFIGLNFIRYLLTETEFQGRVINLDKLTYAANPESLSDIEENFPGRYVFIKGDISDSVKVESVFDSYCVDAVCHFAAESHVDRSISGPGEFINTNIIGTYNLLEAVREREDRVLLFHHISTDEVFGSLGPEGYFTEDTPYSPSSPYSASKASSDHLVRAYHKTYGVPIKVSNCSNNYGPCQFPEKLIPLVILNAIEEKPLPVYGDGKNVRDWLYVRDHCTAVWEIMNRGSVGGTYNIGGSGELENLTVVETICDLIDETVGKPTSIDSRRELITFVKDRPGHDRRYAIDSGKIKAELGWEPEESFSSGIVKTLNWYLGNSDWVEHVRSGEYREWIKRHYG
jgi:dTDP-glucose 4,6-dehydratase